MVTTREPSGFTRAADTLRIRHIIMTLVIIRAATITVVVMTVAGIVAAAETAEEVVGIDSDVMPTRRSGLQEFATFKLRWGGAGLLGWGSDAGE